MMALTAGLVFAPVAYGATIIEPGNTIAEQPQIPNASKNRTRQLKTTFDLKYERVVTMLQNDRRLISDIKKVAAQFDIDPIHMIGAIVGEHTYNVDVLDRAQSYYLKAIAYVKEDIDFKYEGESVAEFVNRAEFESCGKYSNSYDLWTCRENVWDDKFRGRNVDGTVFPNNRFSAVFFQPFYAGQTFGIGQLNPLTALMVTDQVTDVIGGRKLSETNGKAVYRTIMDPKLTLPYMAATIKISIDAYADIAGFDISKNPGLTATLYNTGSPRARAAALAAKNKARSKPIEPQVNYYGWLINEKEEELRSLL